MKPLLLKHPSSLQLMQVVAIYYWIYGEAVCSGEAVIYRYIPAPPPTPAALYRYRYNSTPPPPPGSIILGAVMFLSRGGGTLPILTIYQPCHSEGSLGEAKLSIDKGLFFVDAP